MVNMNKTYDIYDYGVSILGVSIGIDTIKNILGIILLVLSIANICIKLGFKIHDKIKAKKYREIPSDIDDTIDKIDKIMEDMDNGKD